MSIGDRLTPPSILPRPPAGGALSERPGRSGMTPEVYYELKGKLHTRVVDRLDLATLKRLTREQFAQEITAVLTQMVADSELPLNRREREQMVQELIAESLGLGPL